MQNQEEDRHPSTLPGFRVTRDLEQTVTRSRSERKKKRVEFEDVQQPIPNPSQENYPRRCLTKCSNEHNRDSMRPYDTFTSVIKLWKYISTIPPVRDAVVNLFGQFMDIHLGNSDNRLIQALTERWWPVIHTFMFPYAEIEVTPLNFTMLTSLLISRYPTQVTYDDAWSVLSNARQLLSSINSNHIKSENVIISHLKTYLTIAADRDDNITIVRAVIIFMMEHLWFQTANDTLPLGYLAAVADLDEAAQYDWGSAILVSLYHGLDTAVTTGGTITGFSQLLEYWFYEYCGVNHPIVKKEVKVSAYPRLRAWERENMRKINDQATNLFILSRYEIDYRTMKTITWEPWLESAVSEIEGVLTAKLLSRLQFAWQPKGPDPRWHMTWTWRREMFPIHRLRDPPPMSSSYGAEELWHLTHSMRGLVLAESTRDDQRLQELTDENVTLRKHLDSVDDKLHAHDLRLMRGRDVQVMPLPHRGGSRARQRRSGPRTRGGGSSRKGRGTGDDYE
ncbi:hypothetical protein GIB67_019460 [Kingdonia uniflora]|uniref:Aminotransferase-like plant mobile domain-containing protein n=1 Tax=Kingdonia uniflora TaxID=39325 RepID=A0A7J7MU16_9MAGN|nr:hypothetical protein GIB67_019460 [Kingdonia uniflora]